MGRRGSGARFDSAKLVSDNITPNKRTRSAFSTHRVPALECPVRYDRLTGYFQARALTLAARGIEGLVRNSGRMRLLVGCTLDQPEVDAIAKGAECLAQVKAHLLANPLKPGNQTEVEALELLAWMVATQILRSK